MKHYIGEKVKIGGKYGYVGIIAEIKKNGDMTIIDKESGWASVFYYHKGDCLLIHCPNYEQLSLF